MRKLDAMGWEPLEGEAGGLSYDGETADGHPIIGVACREPILSECVLDELTRQCALLRSAREGQTV